MNYALINSSNIVTNVVIWDGTSPFDVPPGSSLELITNPEVGINWSYSGGIFTPPGYWYSTINDNVYGDAIYNIGLQMGSNPPTSVQPPNSTSLVPPTSATGQTLQWTGTEWVYASFDWTDDLATAKAIMVSQTNAIAYGILQPTDWLVVRQTENGTQVPADWNAWRQEIRVQASDKVYKINVCTSKEELNAYCQSDAYLVWANQPTTPTN